MVSTRSLANDVIVEQSREGCYDPMGVLSWLSEERRPGHPEAVNIKRNHTGG